MIVLRIICVIITAAEEVIFLPVFVYLSVSGIDQNIVNRFSCSFWVDLWTRNSRLDFGVTWIQILIPELFPLV